MHIIGAQRLEYLFKNCLRSPGWSTLLPPAAANNSAPKSGIDDRPCLPIQYFNILQLGKRRKKDISIIISSISGIVTDMKRGIFHCCFHCYILRLREQEETTALYNRYSPRKSSPMSKSNKDTGRRSNASLWTLSDGSDLFSSSEIIADRAIFKSVTFLIVN